MARPATFGNSYAHGVAERMKRYNLMEIAAKSTAYYLGLLDKVMRHEALPIKLRMEAGEHLMNRAYGKPFQAIDISQAIEANSVQRVVHIVKWMPPDPEDHSTLIEHTDE